MKRVRSKKTGEVYIMKRTYDDGSVLFSDGRVRKAETVAKYFEEVEDAKGVDAGGAPDVERGTGEASGGRLGSDSTGDDLPHQDGERETGPDAPSGGDGPGDADSVLEV